MEVVEFLGLDIGKKFATLEVLARTQTHRAKSAAVQLVPELLARLLPAVLNPQGLGLDDLIDKLADLLLQPEVALSVVRVLEWLTEPCRFSILHHG